MKKLIWVLVLTTLIVPGRVYAGIKGIEVYTVKEDRVDQDLKKGNRGYLMGKVPEIKDERPTQRTVINVDVELPIFGFESSKKKTDKKTDKKIDKKTQTVSKEKAAVVSKKGVTVTEIVDPSGRGPSEIIEIETEDEWIK